MPQTIKTIELARLFHDTYERLAPKYGYETRDDTKEFDPESENGRLMVATVGEVTKHFADRLLGLPSLQSGPRLDHVSNVNIDEGAMAAWFFLRVRKQAVEEIRQEVAEALNQETDGN